jgi:hypothetical protein
MLKYLQNILTILRYYVNLNVRTLKNIYISVSFTFPSVVGKPISYSRHDLDDIAHTISDAMTGRGYNDTSPKGLR